jgi:hypothetical protein
VVEEPPSLPIYTPSSSAYFLITLISGTI